MIEQNYKKPYGQLTRLDILYIRLRVNFEVIGYLAQLI